MTTSLSPVRPTNPVRRPPPRPGLVLAVVLGAQFMAILDGSIVNVALPTIRTSLNAGGAALQLVVAGYTIAFAVLLVTGARLGDRIGQRVAFLTGLAVFTAASLACGLAWSTAALIGFRFVQGSGAALMVPQVMTVLQRTFEGAARVRALGRYSAVIAVGGVLGQVLGGLLVGANVAGLGWRVVFLVNVPIGLALLATAGRTLPREHGPARRPLDLPGLALLTPAVVLFVVPLVLGHETDWPLWCRIALPGSVLVFAGFVLVERAVARGGGAPLFPGRVVRVPGTALGATALFLVMTAYGGIMFALALHLQRGLGYGPLKAGLVFAPNALAFGLASLHWRRLPARWHAALPTVGLVGSALSFVGLGAATAGGRPIGLAALAMLLVAGIGFGVSYGPVMGLATAGVAPADAADASGLLTTTIQLGQVVGVAGFGTLYLTLQGSAAGASALARASGGALGVSAYAQAGVVLLTALLAPLARRTGRGDSVGA